MATIVSTKCILSFCFTIFQLTLPYDCPINSNLATASELVYIYEHDSEILANETDHIVYHVYPDNHTVMMNPHMSDKFGEYALFSVFKNISVENVSEAFNTKIKRMVCITNDTANVSSNDIVISLGVPIIMFIILGVIIGLTTVCMRLYPMSKQHQSTKV